MTTPSTPYIGRFAPSPTGDLHQGSLFTAVASYLDARHCRGRWLLRMEDLDPPREQPGAADAILRTLEAHQLHWDGEVMYQSRRQDAYQRVLEQLHQAGHTYPCNCNRRRLQQLSVYDGHCRRHPGLSPPWAIRVHIPDDARAHIEFLDLFRGRQQHDLARETGDFVVRRKDGLFAYQLAVVVDDVEQGITHIIRGGDLLDSAARQRWLFQLLDSPPPQMGHLPVLVNAANQKLSKQTFAAPLDNNRSSANLWRALQQLGQSPPAQLQGAPAAELLSWGSHHWNRAALPVAANIEVGD